MSELANFTENELYMIMDHSQLMEEVINDFIDDYRSDTGYSGPIANSVLVKLWIIRKAYHSAYYQFTQCLDNIGTTCIHMRRNLMDSDALRKHLNRIGDDNLLTRTFDFLVVD